MRLILTYKNWLKTGCLVLLLVMGWGSSACAQRVNDSITASLITCSPGKLVYELYGHTALRVTDHTLGTDVVFNYGVFDFNQPHFIWRFTMGRTDYMVQPIPFAIFMEEYAERGSSVTAQRLNLTNEEANALYNKLIENARPENCMYRYNFLTRNCTTMVRDIIESCIHGSVSYREQPKKTYRECLHDFTAGSPWAELGNDVLLGAATDTLLSDRASQFLPQRLESYFAEAVIFDSVCDQRPLVVGNPIVLLPEVAKPKAESFPLSPFACSLIFMTILVVIAAVEYKMHRIFWVVDLLLMPGIGMAGLLVAFMAIFSQHPTLGSNWQVWVLNPLPLFCTPWVIRRASRHLRCWYHPVNAAVLGLFLVASPWIPQHYCLIMFPLTMALLTRPVIYLVNFQRLRPTKKKSCKK